MSRITQLLLIGCSVLTAHAGQRGAKERLDVELSAADRIEIYSVAEAVNEKREPLKKEPLGVVEGIGVGQAFCGVWSIDERSADWQCMCDGDVYLDFYRGRKKLQRLRYFHGLAFRMEDGALTGSAWITKEDRAKVLEWLNQHGAASLKLRVEEEPNQSPEPTPPAGTSAAEQPLVPAAVVAHL